jgi:hypothetical protein
MTVTKSREKRVPEKGEGVRPTVFYAVMVKEPLVGMPGAESVLVPVMLVALVPHMIVADQVKVSPRSPDGNVKVSSWLFRGGLVALVGATTSTVLVVVKAETPDPSAPVTWTCTNSVSLFGFEIPNFHTCWPDGDVLLSESLCLQLIWLKNGFRQTLLGVVFVGHTFVGSGGVTLTCTLSLCDRLGLMLVPVTTTVYRAWAAVGAHTLS